MLRKTLLLLSLLWVVPAFAGQKLTGPLYPASDSTTAIQFNQANGTTNVLDIDTTNGKLGLGGTPTAVWDVLNPITSSAGVAYGTRLQQTLTASANNDNLYGLYIHPTFTNGAFTGVNDYGAYINGNLTTKGIGSADLIDIIDSGGTNRFSVNQFGGGTIGTLSVAGFIYSNNLTGANVATQQVTIQSSQANGTTDSIKFALGNNGATTGLLLQDASGVVTLTAGGILKTIVPTASTASLNLQPSSAVNPSTPNSGDLWWNGTNLYFYNGSTNKDLLAGGGSMVYPGAGIANSTGSAWGTSYTTTGSGTVLMLSTSPKVVTSLLDTNGNTWLGITATGTSVNQFTIANAATSGNPTISTTGTDTNIGITLTPKGSGIVNISSAVTTGGTGQSTVGYGVVLNNGGNTTANGGDVSINNSSAVAVFSVGATSGQVYVAPYVVTVTQSATPFSAVSMTNNNRTIYSITGLAQVITSMTPTGTPTNGAEIAIQFTDNGTARAITWGSSFSSSTVSLPTTTVISTMITVYLMYNSTSSKWVCQGVA